MDYYGSFGDSKANALERMQPVLDSVLEAHETGDYALFRALVTDAFADKVSERGFKQAREAMHPRLGELVSMHFLASLRRGVNPMLVFVARYGNTEDDVLIQATFRNGTYPPKLDALWIE